MVMRDGCERSKRALRVALQKMEVPFEVDTGLYTPREDTVVRQ
jgi:hypothetical protein